MAQRFVNYNRLTKYSVGDLRHRVKIHTRTLSTGDFGDVGFGESYDAGVEMWASVETVSRSGRKMFDGVNLPEGPSPTHVVTVRHRDWITTEHVIRWREELYRIEGTVVKQDERRQYVVMYVKPLGDEDLEANS